MQYLFQPPSPLPPSTAELGSKILEFPPPLQLGLAEEEAGSLTH